MSDCFQLLIDKKIIEKSGDKIVFSLPFIEAIQHPKLKNIDDILATFSHHIAENEEGSIPECDLLTSLSIIENLFDYYGISNPPETDISEFLS